MTALERGAWPILKRYPQRHTARIAMPLGGIGTGTVSLGGRGDLRDWEIMNRPAKGFTPIRGDIAPFFCVWAEEPDGTRHARALEGPVDVSDYEGSHGSAIPNDHLPRFGQCAFAAAYPFGQVSLDDDAMPVRARIEAWNPLIPGDAESSGFPVAVLRFQIENKTNAALKVSTCGVLPNFIGMDGWETVRDWKGDVYPTGAKGNVNTYRESNGLHGVFMETKGVDAQHTAWGTMALSTPSDGEVTHRIDWPNSGWGSAILDFWDDFIDDGRLEAREASGNDMPVASLAIKRELKPGETGEFEFLLTWRFPNRVTWTPEGGEHAAEDIIGNYYAARFDDAWSAAASFTTKRSALETRTLEFINAFLGSDLPEVVKEAALFNVCTLRSQTSFRTPDGRFYGFEGCCNHQGCCWGSCTHVWNYEQATAFLFGDLAMTMREVEFGHATDERGVMSFRVSLPLPRAQRFGKAAADGQMGCIMKMYRDWRLSGDDETLKRLWPGVKRAVEFCWIEGGWDANRDGVMEGCQHNTMDVEYYGPNPQMGVWYLGALRAAEEMAKRVGDDGFADECRSLFERGRAWLDANLFNGEYYIHLIQPPKDRSAIADSLLVGMGARDVSKPDYQLGEGCLVDQLVGQFMAHVCELGYLTDPAHVKTTLKSIMKYNYHASLRDHFNCMRTFALGDEGALLMASYPHSRPENPFPYFTESMTGFEYAAAIGMLYEGMNDEGMTCIQSIRDRYDGLKRSPFNEAECGHHYARAMASWAAVLALTGFSYSAPGKTLWFHSKPGTHFWSNGRAWGVCEIKASGGNRELTLHTLHGEIAVRRVILRDFGEAALGETLTIAQGGRATVKVKRG
ncbi:MAG: hypothetical protein GC154_21405 [bacterium]|nr:hypothetical protein [bacterium]